MISSNYPEVYFGHRIEISENLIIILTNKADAVVMMSDELYFHLDWFVSKQNFRFWAKVNSQEIQQRPLYSSRE